jgi:hypothetical protein
MIRNQSKATVNIEGTLVTVQLYETYQEKADKQIGVSSAQ